MHEKPSPEEALTPKVSIGTYSIASEDHHGENQDSVAVLAGNMGVIVLDGVGGNRGGKEASNLAAMVIKTDLEQLGNTSQADAAAVGMILPMILEHANSEINKENTRLGIPERSGMSTTASVVYIWEGPSGERKAIIGTIGDSTVYVIDAEGNITYTSPEDRYMGNVLSQWLGKHNGIQPSIYISEELKPGSSIVATTDGTDTVSDIEKVQIIRANSNPTEAAEALVNQALAYGSMDDITAAVVVIGGKTSPFETFTSAIDPVIAASEPAITERITPVSTVRHEIPKQPHETEEAKKITIANARNIYELYLAVKAHGDFYSKTNREVHTVDIVMNHIPDVMKKDKDRGRDALPSDGGLRGAVVRIMAKRKDPSQQTYTGTVAEATDVEELFQAIDRIYRQNDRKAVNTEDTIARFLMDYPGHTAKVLDMFYSEHGISQKAKELKKKIDRQQKELEKPHTPEKPKSGWRRFIDKILEG